jgi:hypothetical protein
VRLWDALCGCHLAHLPTDYTPFAAFHPNGESLITSGAAGACCWPLVRTEHAGRARMQVGPPVTLLQLAPEDVRRYRQTIGYAGLGANGRVLCVQNVKQAIIFRTQDGVRWDRCGVISGQPGLARPAISVDGQWIATAALWGSGVWIWNAGSGRVEKRLLADVSTTTAGFSPDGRRLVTGDGQAYQIWEVGTWRLLRSLDKEKATGLGHATFSPDSKILAIFDLRSVVRLIEVNTGRELARLEPPHTHAIRWLRFSPDGSQLAAAATDHQVLIWDLHRISKQLAEMNLLGEMPLFERSPVEHPEPIQVDVDLGEG